MTDTKELIALQAELEAAKKSEVERLLRIEKKVDALIAERDALQAKLSAIEAQMSNAAQRHGLTLLKKDDGYELLKLGQVTAYAAPTAQQPAQQAQPAEASSGKSCMTCKHSDSWGLPDCSANGALCLPTQFGGSNWEPLNATSLPRRS